MPKRGALFQRKRWAATSALLTVGSLVRMQHEQPVERHGCELDQIATIRAPLGCARGLENVRLVVVLGYGALFVRVRRKTARNSEADDRRYCQKIISHRSIVRFSANGQIVKFVDPQANCASGERRL